MSKVGTGTTTLLILVLVCVPVTIGVMQFLAWHEVDEGFEKLHIGARDTDVLAAFDRDPDCVFNVGSHTAMYFVPHDLKSLYSARVRKCLDQDDVVRLDSWTELPRGIYQAAFVVVSSDGRVEALSVLGEEPLSKAPGSEIGLSKHEPFAEAQAESEGSGRFECREGRLRVFGSNH